MTMSHKPAATPARDAELQVPEHRVQELREMIEKKNDKKDLELKALKKRNQELEKELQRKEKALAEAAALLLLKKKLDALMEDQKDD